MKRSILLIISILALYSCEKEEPKLELFSPEIFAYNIGDFWEVNASINVKGFQQNEEGDIYQFMLNYTVDLITSESDTLKEIDSGIVKDESPDEFIDTNIESQIELDSTFAVGTYQIIFNVEDIYSKQKVSIKAPFQVNDD